jgi:hypothetical protein
MQPAPQRDQHQVLAKPVLGVRRRPRSGSTASRPLKPRTLGRCFERRQAAAIEIAKAIACGFRTCSTVSSALMSWHHVPARPQCPSCGHVAGLASAAECAQAGLDAGKDALK